MKDPQTQRSRGFAFVTFESTETVDDVIKFGKHMIDDKSVDPKVAFPKKGTPKMVTKTKKIFVGGLASSTNEDDLKAYVSTCYWQHNSSGIPWNFMIFSFRNSEKWKIVCLWLIERLIGIEDSVLWHLLKKSVSITFVTSSSMKSKVSALNWWFSKNVCQQLCQIWLFWKYCPCKKAQPKEVMMPALQRAIKARAVQFSGYMGGIQSLKH